MGSRIIMGKAHDLQGSKSYGLFRGGKLMEDLINEEILERIYEEIQEEWPDLCPKDWTALAEHRFSEGG